ncbi:MAG: PLP-dependent aminotransferase family protein [Acidobacteria bacterium]|nr:MAG: PLP-dependent aminotransferase family protein [Acidobacteriota bacterium]
MTSWTPDLTRRSGPRYRALADALADDVAGGRLAAGARLPTHRDMAASLGVTVGTVSRGYAEAQRRGLISGEVGRGTFVRRADDDRIEFGMPAIREASLIDLSLNFPISETEDREVARALLDLSRRKDLAGLLSYLPHAGLPAHRDAGAAWAARAGFEARPDQILITNGAQQALSIALAALAAPGDLVLTEALTYPLFRTLAGLLHLKIQGLPMDDQGLKPEAFEAACRAGAPRFLYCIPTIQNPTVSIMPEARRRRIAAIAQAHGVTILEDDIYGILPEERPAPIALHAPDHVIYVTSLSKTLTPGLRIGYLLAPRRLLDRIVPAMGATTWMASPLMAELATRFIGDGTADLILKRRRKETAARLEMAARILRPARAGAHPHSYHFWLPLPEPWKSDEFASRLRERGVAVTPAEAFLAAAGKPPAAIRICLGAARTRDQLERGLRIIADTLAGAPGPPGEAAII